MYKPLQKKNSSWTPTTAQKKSKSASKLGHFSIQPKPNQKSSQSPEIGEYSRDSADRLAANVMRSLEAKGSQETETPTVQPQSESRISVADVVGQRMPTLTPHTLNPLQRKLTVGQPGDKYEQEADTVAAKVVEQINSPTSQQSVQGKVEPVAQPTVMRDGGVGGGAVDASVEQSIQQAKGSGQGLSEDVREPMEQAFGADFSGVRVHNNSNADQLNRSLNARAFTTGPDIFFKQGEYNPGSRDGQELLAHELTHVVQQSGSQLKTKQTGSVKLMRSLEAKGSQETETPTVQPQSESRISVADVVGQRMPTVMPLPLTPQVRMTSEVVPENPIQRQCADFTPEQQIDLAVSRINAPDAQTVQRQSGSGNQLSNDSERLVYQLRHQISAAATSDVSAGLIAAILYDENQRRNALDSIQDTEARFIIWYEGLLENAEVNLWELTTGKPVREQTFGASQMQPQVVEELVRGGYINQPQGWNGDELDKSLELLLDQTQAPNLVAGRLQQTVEHWRNGGVDISQRPEILGTLYHLGLTGRSGVNPNPQPNARGTQIAATIPRMEQILAMP